MFEEDLVFKYSQTWQSIIPNTNKLLMQLPLKIVMYSNSIPSESRLFNHRDRSRANDTFDNDAPTRHPPKRKLLCKAEREPVKIREPLP